MMPARRRVPALIVGLALLAGLVWGALALLPGRGASRTEPADAAGLSVVNVELIDGAEGNKQRVAYDLHWAGSEFPGAFECAWRVLDGSGAEIGLVADEVLSLRPSAVGAYVDVPVDGDAASATAECDVQRLDVGGSYGYAFSPGEVFVPQPGQFGLPYESTWLGDGLPGAVTCRATVRDQAGEVVAAKRVNIAGEASGDAAIYIDVDGVTEVEPGFTGAIEECEPFVAE